MFDFGTFDFFVGLALLWLFFKGLELLGDLWNNLSYQWYKWKQKRKGLDYFGFPLKPTKPTNDQTKNKN
jgi:hypothetical protein